MARQIRPSHAAVIDVGDHIDYLVDNANEATARRFVEALRNAYDLLAEMPGIGSRRDYGNADSQDIRIWTIAEFPKYLIVYTSSISELTVLRVLHGARDMNSIFGGTS